MKEKMPEKSLEGRVLRDRIAEIGLVGGFIGGVIYTLATNDNERGLTFQKFMHDVVLASSGGAGLTYCIGTIVKPIYERMKKY